MHGLRKHLLRHQGGTAVIEFAILTPVFLLMITGMLAYGIYFGAAHSLQQLAADAVRVSIAGLSTAERDGLVDTYLKRHAGAYMLIDPQRLRHEMGAHPDDADQYRLVLRYDASDLPIWNLYPPLPLPAQNIIIGATIRRGGL